MMEFNDDYIIHIDNNDNCSILSRHKRKCVVEYLSSPTVYVII